MDDARGTGLAATGFYGKLPGYGDFLRRRLPDEFVHFWDEWLQRSLVASRQALGEGWLPAYLTSPVWRFAISPQGGAASGWAGVLVPSVDSVGRYFPFCVATPLPPAASLHRCAVLATAWFDAVEDIARAALEDDRTDLDALADTLAQAGERWPTSAHLAAGTLAVPDAQEWSRPHWRGGATSAADIGLALLDAFAGVTNARLRPLSLWWTDGSDRVAPCWLMTRGLPEPSSYAAMLTGEWGDGQWLDWGGGSPPPAVAVAAEPRSFSITSAGASEMGHVRRNNEDAYLVRAEAGIWAVADGVGGHEHGEVASGMVVDALAALRAGTLDDTVEQARAALREVNRALRARWATDDGEAGAGSTVVVLALRGDAGAVMWAGDSRLYRLRGGALEQLTRDHVYVPADPMLSLVAVPAGEITRAVGAEDDFDLDVGYFAVDSGDRLLLCSDGVHGEVSEEQIARGLACDSAEAACRAIMEDVLRSPARDNASAVVVFVA